MHELKNMNVREEIISELKDLITFYKYQDRSCSKPSEKVDLSKYRKIIEKTKPIFKNFGMEKK